MSTETLRTTLKSRRTVLRVMLGIFLLVIGAWIVLGYWRSNLPVFISTVALSVVLTAILSASATAVERELQRRD